MPIPVSNPVSVAFPSHGIAVLESRHAADFSMQEVAWDFLVVLHIFSGSGMLVSQHQQYVLSADRIVLVPAGLAYRLEDRAGDPLWLSLICVRQDVLDQLAVRCDRLLHVLPPAVDRSAWRNRLRELMERRESDAPYAQLGLVALALTLLRDILEQAERPARTTARQRMERYVHELPGRLHQVVDLDHAANSLELSRRRFTQLFRDVTGTSWLQHVHQRRLEQACRLLEQTERPVQAISFESGFDDPAGFYRAFRKSQGMTPGQWRATRR